MSEQPKWFVGQDVFVMGCDYLRPAKIARITPSGRPRIVGDCRDFDRHGHSRNPSGWMSGLIWLTPATPELVARHQLEVRMNAVNRRIQALTKVNVKSVSASDLESAFKCLTEALNILTKPDEGAAS